MGWGTGSAVSRPTNRVVRQRGTRACRQCAGLDCLAAGALRRDRPYRASRPGRARPSGAAAISSVVPVRQGPRDQARGVAPGEAGTSSVVRIDGLRESSGKRPERDPPARPPAGEVGGDSPAGRRADAAAAPAARGSRATSSARRRRSGMRGSSSAGSGSPRRSRPRPHFRPGTRPRHRSSGRAASPAS